MDMNYRGGMWEGGGWAGWSGVGGEWDNCNSIINKYIFFKNYKKGVKKLTNMWRLKNILLKMSRSKKKYKMRANV